MSIRAMTWALDTGIGDWKAKIVLVVLADSANDDSGQCWPSLANLCRRCELSESSVKRAIRYLVKHNFIKRYDRQRENGSTTSSLFTVLVGGLIDPRVQLDPPGGSLRTPAYEPSIEPRKKERKKVPEAYASSADFFPNSEITEPPVPVDEPPKARLYREGRTLLVALGVSETTSGRMIGKWLKQNPDAVGILAALTYAYENNVIEPIGYVTKLLKNGARNDGRHTGRKTLVELGKELAEEARLREFEAGIGREAYPQRSY